MEPEIRQIARIQAQETRQNLTRAQRISLRNEIILAKISTGITVEQIQEEFQLSRAQVYNIIKDAEEEVEEWFHNFPKRAMLSLFRSNVLAVTKEISELTNLKNQAQDFNEKMDIHRAIIDARIKHNRLIAEGPTYVRIKQLVKNSEQQT